MAAHRTAPGRPAHIEKERRTRKAGPAGRRFRTRLGKHKFGLSTAIEFAVALGKLDEDIREQYRGERTQAELRHKNRRLRHQAGIFTGTGMKKVTTGLSKVRRTTQIIQAHQGRGKPQARYIKLPNARLEARIRKLANIRGNDEIYVTSEVITDTSPYPIHEVYIRAKDPERNGVRYFGFEAKQDPQLYAEVVSHLMREFESGCMQILDGEIAHYNVSKEGFEERLRKFAQKVGSSKRGSNTVTIKRSDLERYEGHGGYMPSELIASELTRLSQRLILGKKIVVKD